MKREMNTLGKAAIAAVLAACSLGAPPSLASASTPSPSVQEKRKNPYDVLNAAAARGPITVTPLRGGVYLLQGSGGIIGVLPSKDGAFMVDAGIAVSRRKLERALQKLGASHIRYLVNTHWHFDHTGGNSWVHERGAEIIAAPNTLRNLSETIRVVEWAHTFTPVPAAARPTVTVASEKTFTFPGMDRSEGAPIWWSTAICSSPFATASPTSRAGALRLNRPLRPSPPSPSTPSGGRGSSARTSSPSSSIAAYEVCRIGDIPQSSTLVVLQRSEAGWPGATKGVLAVSRARVPRLLRLQA
jgi:hypothetical protein